MDATAGTHWHAQLLPLAVEDTLELFQPLSARSPLVHVDSSGSMIASRWKAAGIPMS